MIAIDAALEPVRLLPSIDLLFELSGPKILALNTIGLEQGGAPVYTVGGRYTSRGWTEWTQGFQFGSALLQFEATGDRKYLTIGTEGIVNHMATHVSHVGVHDHGFNNISTYGNLLRLIRDGLLPCDDWQVKFCELGLKLSGAIQAARWTSLPDKLGFIYSFNGPHSLFVDTMRSLRVLAVAHKLGHVLMGEQDRPICLLERLIQHAETTARYSIYFGEGRDFYDVCGRTAHESIFNISNGSYRCPSTQQGYSPFSTWTRGLAWAVLGFAEQLEFLDSLPEERFLGLQAGNLAGKAAFLKRFLSTAQAVADFYIRHSPSDGIPYWDTGAPGLVHMSDYLSRPANPFNEFEPVDSSAASIAAQGLLRLGRYLSQSSGETAGAQYVQAGLTVAKALFDDPYIARDPEHQGLILHSLYHRPNAWDHIPGGSAIPSGEATLWGDYHARELGVYIKKLAANQYHTFWSGV